LFDYNQKPDLNITPLVDIMLVLLAILMVTAPVMEFEEPINLPQGSKSKHIQDISNITITITKDRKIVLNKKNYDIKTFADDFLLFSKNKDQKSIVSIRADKNLKYDDVIFVLKSVKEAGFTKVSLVTDG
jgi:biopolymer transport protein ExbD